jgi:hypothetical protein
MNIFLLLRLRVRCLRSLKETERCFLIRKIDYFFVDRLTPRGALWSDCQ